MPSHPRAAVVALALTLALAGCGSTTTPTSLESTAAPAGPPSTNALSAPAAQTQLFAFPDGRTSFRHPAGWTVDLVHAPEGGTATATVASPDGALKLAVFVGRITDAVTGPVTRTVLDEAPVPGLAQQPAPAAHYAFYLDDGAGLHSYHLRLVAGSPDGGEAMALDGIIRTETGILLAEVQFAQSPAFQTTDAAKAWLASAQGQQVRAMLLSISYA